MIIATAVLYNNSEEQYRAFHETVDRFSEDTITMEPMTDPISIECGHVFERASFQDIANYSNLHQLLVRCPTCQVQVNPNIMVPNLAVRQVVPMLAKLKEENACLNKELIEESNKCCVVRCLEKFCSCVEALTEKIEQANAYLEGVKV